MNRADVVRATVGRRGSRGGLALPLVPHESSLRVSVARAVGVDSEEVWFQRSTRPHPPCEPAFQPRFNVASTSASMRMYTRHQATGSPPKSCWSALEAEAKTPCPL